VLRKLDGSGRADEAAVVAAEARLEGQSFRGHTEGSVGIALALRAIALPRLRGRSGEVPLGGVGVEVLGVLGLGVEGVFWRLMRRQ
jgi:hypothetical protein